MITAQLKRLHSPDVPDLVSYSPPDASNFGFLLQIIAGPAGEPGEESFDVTVCTPSFLDNQLAEDGILIGRHYLLVNRYDYVSLKRFVTNYFDNCRGQSWREVAEQLGRFGKWEFEDYQS